MGWKDNKMGREREAKINYTKETKQNRKKRMYSFEVDISVFQGKGIAEER